MKVRGTRVLNGNVFTYDILFAVWIFIYFSEEIRVILIVVVNQAISAQETAAREVVWGGEMRGWDRRDKLD